jgi:hypothetical protein
MTGTTQTARRSELENKLLRDIAAPLRRMIVSNPPAFNGKFG